MSLLSGLFTLPIHSALQAYKAAHYELLLQRKHIDVATQTTCYERFLKKTCTDQTILENIRGMYIKTMAMQDFFTKSGIRSDVMVVETPNIGLCQAVGTNIFKGSDAVILVEPGLYQVDKNLCTITIKHEVSHILNNDEFTKPCVVGVCQLAASIFGMRCLSFWPALGISFTVGIVSQSLFSMWREAVADDFAIENSSDPELKAFRCYLIALQELHLENRNTFFRRCVISVNGDDRLDIFHPSCTSRIKKIEKALRDRNAPLLVDGAKDERQQIESLNRYTKKKVIAINEAAKQTGGILSALKQMCSF